jgi:hypothetical protein
MEIKTIVENRITEIWQEFSDLEMCKISPLSVVESDETIFNRAKCVGL